MQKEYKIPIVRPSLPCEESFINIIRDIYKTKRLSNFDKYSSLVEDSVFNLFNESAFFATVSSCDIGLTLAIKLFDFKEGSEIIVPSFTFQSTINAIKWNNLVPVFADINSETLNIDLNSIKKLITYKTVAILATHTFGNPVDSTIEIIANDNRLNLIFDAAHAFGSKIENNWNVCSYGDIGVFSFSGTKVISCGEGGLVYFRNNEQLDKFKYLRNYGFISDYNTKYLGLNGKLSEIHAALLWLQLDMLEDKVKRRNEIANLYKELLNGFYSFQKIQDGYLSSYKDMAVIVGNAKKRDGIIQYLEEQGIQTKKYFYPQHLTDYYRSNISLPATEDIYSRIICVPIFNDMTNEEVIYVVKHLNRATE